MSVLHATFHIYAGTEACHVRGTVIGGELDADRYALAHFHKVAGRIVLRKNRQRSSCGGRYGPDFAVESDAGHSVDLYVYLASRFDVAELSLLIVGSHPDVARVYNVEECLSRLDELPYLNVFARGIAVAGSDDYRVA